MFESHFYVQQKPKLYEETFATNAKTSILEDHFVTYSTLKYKDKHKRPKNDGSDYLFDLLTK